MSLSKLRGKEFINEELKISITTYKDENGTILFIASQVASALGYKDIDSAIRRHVKNNHRRVIGTGEKTPGVSPGVKVPVLKPNSIGITEPGFWSLAFGSKLPVADKLRDWVFEEVLPSIREYGYYALPGVLEAVLRIDKEEVKALTDGSDEKKEFRKEAYMRADLAKDETAMKNGSKGGKQRHKNSIFRKYFNKWLVKTLRSKSMVSGIKMRFLESENRRLRNCLERVSEELDDSDTDVIGIRYPDDLSPLTSDDEC